MHHVTAFARDLLFRLLRPEPKERLTVNQVLQHPWVVGPG
jgi:serine/threonine protein kinase